MANVKERISALKAEFEARRQKFRKVEAGLKDEADSWKARLEETEEQLEEALWQEALETVENELKPLYLRKRQQEAGIVTRANELFATTREAADRIKSMQNDLTELKEEIESLEDQVIQAGSDGAQELKEAMALKKTEAEREHQVPDYSDGAYALLRHFNVSARDGDATAQLIARSFGHVPEPVGNIFRAVAGSGGKLRTREDRLLMLSGIKEPRIIAARDQLTRYLDNMQNQGLIQLRQGGGFLLDRGRRGAGICPRCAIDLGMRMRARYPGFVREGGQFGNKRFRAQTKRQRFWDETKRQSVWEHTKPQ